MEILFDIKQTTGIITLNRPQALNALNLSMAEQFANKLQEWQEDQNNPLPLALFYSFGMPHEPSPIRTGSVPCEILASQGY